jgi:uncharacterized protein
VPGAGVPFDDPLRAVAFYSNVLGWASSRFDELPYWLVTAGDEAEPGADGAISGRDAVHQAPVVVAAVDDIDAALGRVTAHGGVVLQAKLPVPGVGWSAYFVDPEGNTIGLFQNDPAAAP